MKVVLIIEDDYPFAVEIEMMLNDLGSYIPKIVSTYSEAQQILTSLLPDIILSDIHLDNDRTVFDLLDHRHEEIPLVLFSSSDNEDIYVRAKALKSYIFLIKPFNVKSLRSAVENLMNNTRSEVNTFFVKSSGKHISISVDEVRYIESEGNYSNLYLKQKIISTRSTFENIINKCNSPNLIRVHRGYIVNTKFIESIQTNGLINIKFGGEIPIGRKYKAAVKSLLSQ